MLCSIHPNLTKAKLDNMCMLVCSFGWVGSTHVRNTNSVILSYMLYNRHPNLANENVVNNSCTKSFGTVSLADPVAKHLHIEEQCTYR